MPTNLEISNPAPSTTAEIQNLLAASRPEAGPWMVALDIDGTIIDYDARMSAEMRRAVADLVAAGAQVVLATGRSLLGTRQIIDQLGLQHGWAISSNGAITIRLDPNLPDGYEISDTITFDPRPALEALRTELPEALIAVEKIGVGHKVNAPFPPHELTGDFEVADFEELCDTPATRVAVRSPEHTREEFSAAVARAGLQGVSYSVGWLSWMDINPAQVNKATALEPVRTRLNIARAKTVAAGDGSNDLEMLRWARVSGAMGQADQPVHAAADLHLGSIDDDGLIPLLREVIAEMGESL